MKATVHGTRIRIDGHEIEAPFAVIQAVWDQTHGIVLALMDYNANLSTKKFHNLVAFDLSGRKVWEAELPTSGQADCYTDLSLGSDGLRAFAFSCFSCHIDLLSGKILDKMFTG